jgi:hypothetical protein
MMTEPRSEFGPKGVEPTEAAEPSEAREKAHRDEGMDKTLADSFPASDPPSSIPNPDEEGETAA